MKKEKQPKEYSAGMELQYGSDVFVLPKAVLEHLDRANELDLRVLLLLASDAALREDLDEGLLAERLGAEKEEIHDAITYWRGAGLLKCSKKTSKAAKAVKVPPALPSPQVQESETPSASIPPAIIEATYYSPEDLQAAFVRHAELKALIEDCKAAIGGKTFKNEYDSSAIVMLIDYYHLSPEFVLLGFQHFGDQGIRSVSACYKNFCRLLERGICTEQDFNRYLQEEKLRASLAGKLKELLGHTLTEKEKRFAAAWAEAGHTGEMLRAAYDLTVDSTGEVALPYMNKILTDWKEKGITTPAQALAEAEQFRLEKKAARAAVSPKASAVARGRKPKPPMEFSSFDEEEFFADAVAAAKASDGDISDEEVLRQVAELQEQYRKEHL